MICCLASAACPLRDTAAPLAACGGREGIRAVYDAGIDLGHYGEVDQLAPAGAMAEFTAYVRRQSEEEAEAAFAPLRQAARSRGVVPYAICCAAGGKKRPCGSLAGKACPLPDSRLRAGPCPKDLPQGAGRSGGFLPAFLLARRP